MLNEIINTAMIPCLLLAFLQLTILEQTETSEPASLTEPTITTRQQLTNPSQQLFAAKTSHNHYAKPTWGNNNTRSASNTNLKAEYHHQPVSGAIEQQDVDYYYYPERQKPEHIQQNQDEFSFPPHHFADSHINSFLEKEYLNHELSERACKLDRGCQRTDRLNNTYLSYCTRYKLANLLSNEILMSIMHDSTDECNKILNEFIQLDELINQFDRLFKNLLLRYNCHNGYSVKWSCDDCKKAYKDWLCATNLPYYMNGEQIKPCISYCERVEQRCPYFHPIMKEQYGGQPVFICRDPNVPFVPEITPDIPYSEPTKCYDLCHLSDNETELTIDSLSKYDYDKCPDKGSIAEEVRSDPAYCGLGHDPSILNINDTMPLEASEGKDIRVERVGGPNVHTKKLSGLQEVLAVYKSQPKTHKFGHHSHRE